MGEMEEGVGNHDRSTKGFVVSEMSSQCGVLVSPNTLLRTGNKQQLIRVLLLFLFIQIYSKYIFIFISLATVPRESSHLVSSSETSTIDYFFCGLGSLNMMGLPTRLWNLNF